MGALTHGAPPYNNTTVLCTYTSAHCPAGSLHLTPPRAESPVPGHLPAGEVPPVVGAGGRGERGEGGSQGSESNKPRRNLWLRTQGLRWFTSTTHRIFY